MLELIKVICGRLQDSQYASEAGINHGVISPILNALGWDSADPGQVVPEYKVEGGAVDFALLGPNRKPRVFIEAKALGRAAEGDIQLLGYAFKYGVPLGVLTDGRDWSFYLPGGMGSYQDRRIYRLQLDERSLQHSSDILNRYLSRDRVLSGAAFEDAKADHDSAAGSRDAIAMLPHAWRELVAEAHELIVDTLAEKADALSGYRPEDRHVAAFLTSLRVPPAAAANSKPTVLKPVVGTAPVAAGKTIEYTLFGERRSSPSASRALVDILRTLEARTPNRLQALADAVRTKRMAHIAHSPAEINPRKPEIARAVEIATGWMVGLNIDNRTKMMIVRAAATVYELDVPLDLDIAMPNG